MAGDKDEFAEFYRREYTACVSAARRVLLEDHRAEEAAAEAFIRAWSRWRRVRRLSSPGGWVMRVTTNVALDQIRRGPAPTPATADRDAIEDVVTTHLMLADAINRLPRRQRTAISLRYFGDLSVDEVAAAMDVTAGSVKTHLHRGLATLRSLLDDPTGLEHRLDIST